ncbi:hypothetical protein HNO88_001360 [Novosphingobium chloroacetimidivorans]|uniref:Uncharacterized protein n=1 Tax=Novosphingobium chloroacetimidivorans TaxID=1428314 RepID=A0A7W7K8U4_9SPHN|nr:hypothetical protein [Novosphingobium chloroacetimidivorans]MBB4858046.1 hypothetical protein [Novosphingobium chloroacetimidivorans]
MLLVIAALALSGCQKADNAPGPGGVTVGEARALDEAAEMIEARRPPPDLVAPSSTQWPSGQASATSTP